MSNIITVQPARLERTLYGTDGVTQYSPALGAPANIEITTTANAWLAVAFTPSGTTVTLYHPGDDATFGAVFTNATARINGCGGINLKEVNYLRCWARRKPGATGAITAQKIILKSWDGSALAEVGRLYVSAVAAGTDETVSDVCQIIRTDADPLLTFPSAHPFNVVFESADTNLEVCMEAHGNHL